MTQAHLDARRREILEAAFRRFSRQGLHGTTMREIAEEAGLSAGALYRYFEGKEALVEALAGWGREQKRAVLRRLEPGEGADALAEAVTEMMGALLSEAGEASVRLDVRLWAEALDNEVVERLGREAFADLREAVAAYLRAERDAGRIRSDVEPSAVGRAVVSLMAGVALQRALEADLDLESYRTAVRALLSGLRPGC